MADRASLRRRLGLGVPAVLALALVAFFGVRAVAASGAETDRYATATVTRGSVAQTYTGSGSVAKVDQASATFPTSGTVTAVEVKVGDKVSAGDTLATIDDTALADAVDEAQQTLDAAEVALAGAQDAAAEATASPSATATPTATAGAPSPSTSSPAKAEPSAAPTSARPSSGSGSGDASGSPRPTGASTADLTRAVREAQTRLTALTDASRAELAAQQKACAALSNSSPTAGPTASAAPSDTATPTPTATPSGTATPTRPATPAARPGRTATADPTTTASPTAPVTPVPSTDAATLSACITAVVAVQQTQLRVGDQQAVVAAALTALGQADSSSADGSQGSGSPSSGSSSGTGSSSSTKSSGTGSSGTKSSGTGGSNSSSSGARSSAPASGSSSRQSSAGSTAGSRSGQTTVTVGSAQAAVTKDRIALTTAKAQVAAATMTAPITGVVSAVPFAKGDTASSSDQVVVIGRGSVEVVMNVPEASFRTLAVGQRATVSTPGSPAAPGKVTRLGLLPNDTSTGTGSTAASSSGTTYPVTVLATGTKASALASGATASVAVTLRRATNVVVAPVSAVTRSGTTGTVQVLTDGAPTRTDVTLGAVGAATVEVTKGLDVGRTLVLADNDTALPTASTGGRTGALGTGGPPPGSFGAAPGGR